LTSGNSTRHSRDMEDDSADAEFLAWAKANASSCGEEIRAKALDETRALSQRRLIRTEILHASIEKYVAAHMEKYNGKKDAVIVEAANQFKVAERTVWNALVTLPPPVAPPMTKNRLRSILADNLDIAERSNNFALFEHISLQSVFVDYG
jgi:hypothetical protein